MRPPQLRTGYLTGSGDHNKGRIVHAIWEGAPWAACGAMSKPGSRGWSKDTSMALTCYYCAQALRKGDRIEWITAMGYVPYTPTGG